MTNYEIGANRERIAIRLAVGGCGVVVKGGGSKSIYPSKLAIELRKKFGLPVTRYRKGKKIIKYEYPKIDFMAVPVVAFTKKNPFHPLRRPLAMIVTDAKKYKECYLRRLVKFMQKNLVGCDVKIMAFKKPPKGLKYIVELYE